MKIFQSFIRYHCTGTDRYLVFYFTFLILIFILIALDVLAEENYCIDPGSWKKWDALVLKHPDDLDIQILHALRVCLCMKAEEKISQ